MRDEEANALERLQAKIIKTPVRVTSRFQSAYTMDTDNEISKLDVYYCRNNAAVPKDLSGYWCHLLKYAEKADETTLGECLAGIWEVLFLWIYFEVCQFTVRTDHDSLKWILNLTVSLGKMGCWKLHWSKFELHVVHRNAMKHQAGEDLLLLKTKGDYQMPIDDEKPVL